MDKHYEAIKEILDEQVKKIVKKGDISPQELENLYKASAVLLDFETRDAMKKMEEKQKEQSQGEQSQRGGYSQGQSQAGGQSGGSYGQSGGSYGQSGGSYGQSGANGGQSMGGQSMGGYSGHYMFPWMMAYEGGSSRGSYGGGSSRGSYAGGSSREGSSRGSYDGSWDEGTAYGEEMSERGSYARGGRGSGRGSYEGGSNDYSERRGRSRRTGRYVSRDYSGAEDKEMMLERLETMLEDASSERDRRALEQCIERISK